MLGKAITGAFALIIVIVGVLMLFRWSKKNERLRLFGGALFLIGVFVFLDTYVEITGVFTAWATLVLAFGTFLMVDENNRLRNQTQRIYEQDKKIAFRRRYLDEIVDWVQDVRLEIFRVRPTELAEFDLRISLVSTTARIAWASRISKIFGEELETAVKTASDNLLEFIKPVNKGQINLQTVEQAFNAVLDIVFKIKTGEML